MINNIKYRKNYFDTPVRTSSVSASVREVNNSNSSGGFGNSNTANTNNNANASTTTLRADNSGTGNAFQPFSGRGYSWGN